MNIYEKIQKVKLELSKRELKKSGENSYSGFKYYELGDFMPSIIELCNKYSLCTQISFENDKAILSIIDSDINNVIKNEVDNSLIYPHVDYSSPIRELELKGANAIQALGGIQTYLRRYLYMNAFDIVEADMFDSVEFEKKRKKKAEKGTLDLLIESCKTAFKEANDEIKSELGTTMKTLGYTNFAELSKKQNKNDIVSLAKVLNVEIPEELVENKKEKKEDKK